MKGTRTWGLSRKKKKSMEMEEGTSTKSITLVKLEKEHIHQSDIQSCRLNDQDQTIEYTDHDNVRKFKCCNQLCRLPPREKFYNKIPQTIREFITHKNFI